MIVTKKDQHFRLFTQHDHAQISGEIASHWPSELFQSDKLRDEVEYAIYQHDRAWIPLDESPLWNEEKGQPNSFMDFPMEPKINHYEKGIDEVQQKSLYAGLLCSTHYLSFFDQSSTNPIVQQFISQEISRHEQIKDELGRTFDEEAFQFHYRLLQFCDDLSLYFCLNEPGADKSNENKMFKDGFRQQFEGLSHQMTAYWNNPKNIELEPFPFHRPFKIEIPYKLVSNEEIDQYGFQKAFETALVKSRPVQLVSKQ